MIIALCGYMGAGKTTLGKMLAQELNFAFCDTDDYIESEKNMKISQIFETYGEQYFRELEFDALCHFKNEDNIILSLGGGLPIADKNKTILEDMIVVYIDSSFEDCYNRIEKSNRPIVKQKTKEQLKQHFDDRISHYKKVANLICKGNDLQKMKEQIVKFVKEKI